MAIRDRVLDVLATALAAAVAEPVTLEEGVVVDHVLEVEEPRDEPAGVPVADDAPHP